MRYSRHTITTVSMQANTAGATSGGATQGRDMNDISSGANDSQIFRSCLQAYFQKRLSSSPVSSGDELQPRQPGQLPQECSITCGGMANDSQATMNNANTTTTNNNNVSSTSHTFVIATSPPVQYTNLLISAPIVFTTHNVPPATQPAGPARHGGLSDATVQQLTVYSDTDELVGLQDNSPLSSSTHDVAHGAANEHRAASDNVTRHTPADQPPLGSARSRGTPTASPSRGNGPTLLRTPETRSLSSTTHERSPASARTSPCVVQRPVARSPATQTATTSPTTTTTPDPANERARRSLTSPIASPTPLPPPPASRTLGVKKVAPSPPPAEQRAAAVTTSAPTTSAAPALSQVGAPSAAHAATEEEEEELCCICLETYTKDNPQFFSACRHHFHLACLLAWKDRCNTCPMCNMDTLQGIGDTDDDKDAAKRNTAASAATAADTSADAALAQQLQEHYQRQLRRLRRRGQAAAATAAAAVATSGTASPQRPETRPAANTSQTPPSANAARARLPLPPTAMAAMGHAAMLHNALRPPEAPNMNAREHGTHRLRQRTNAHETEREKACSVM